MDLNSFNFRNIKNNLAPEGGLVTDEIFIKDNTHFGIAFIEMVAHQSGNAENEKIAHEEISREKKDINKAEKEIPERDIEISL